LLLSVSYRYLRIIQNGSSDTSDIEISAKEMAMIKARRHKKARQAREAAKGKGTGRPSKKEKKYKKK